MLPPSGQVAAQLAAAPDSSSGNKAPAVNYTSGVVNSSGESERRTQLSADPADPADPAGGPKQEAQSPYRSRPVNSPEIPEGGALDVSHLHPPSPSHPHPFLPVVSSSCHCVAFTVLD